jgi:hypothetical protein
MYKRKDGQIALRECQRRCTNCGSRPFQLVESREARAVGRILQDGARHVPRTFCSQESSFRPGRTRQLIYSRHRIELSVPGSMPGGPGVPENITVTFLNPTSVKVSWSTSVENVDKYDVTYKPTDARYGLICRIDLSVGANGGG